MAAPFDPAPRNVWQKHPQVPTQQSALDGWCLILPIVQGVLYPFPVWFQLNLIDFSWWCWWFVQVVQKFWPWIVAIMELQDIFPVSHVIPWSSIPKCANPCSDLILIWFISAHFSFRCCLVWQKYISCPISICSKYSISIFSCMQIGDPSTCSTWFPLVNSEHGGCTHGQKGSTSYVLIIAVSLVRLNPLLPYIKFQLQRTNELRMTIIRLWWVL